VEDLFYIFFCDSPTYPGDSRFSPITYPKVFFRLFKYASVPTSMNQVRIMSDPSPPQPTPKETFIYLLVDVVKSFDNIPSSVLGHTVEECKDRCRAVYKEYRRQIKAHELVLEERTNEIISKDVFIEKLHQRYDDQAGEAAYLETALNEAHARISEVEMNYNSMKNAYHRLAGQYLPQLRPRVKKEQDSDGDSVPAIVVRPVSKAAKKRRREWECLSQFQV